MKRVSGTLSKNEKDLKKSRELEGEIERKRERHEKRNQEKNEGTPKERQRKSKTKWLDRFGLMLSS